MYLSTTQTTNRQHCLASKYGHIMMIHSSWIWLIAGLIICMTGQIIGHKANRVFDYEPNYYYMMLLKQLENKLSYTSDAYTGQKDPDFVTYKLLAQTAEEDGRLRGVSIKELVAFNFWDFSDCTIAAKEKRWNFCSEIQYIDGKSLDWIWTRLISYCKHIGRKIDEDCGRELHRLVAEKLDVDYGKTVSEFYRDVERSLSSVGNDHTKAVRLVLNEKEYDLKELKEICIVMDEKYQDEFYLMDNYRGLWSNYYDLCGKIFMNSHTIDGTMNEVYHYESPKTTTTGEIVTAIELLKKLSTDLAPDCYLYNSYKGYRVYKLLVNTSDKKARPFGASVEQLFELNKWDASSAVCTKAEYERRERLCPSFYGITSGKAAENVNIYCSHLIEIFHEECSSKLTKLANEELADRLELVKEVISVFKNRFHYMNIYGKAPLKSLLNSYKHNAEELKNICSILDENYGQGAYKLELWSRYHNLCGDIVEHLANKSKTPKFIRKFFQQHAS